MRIISYDSLVEAVETLCKKAAYDLPEDVFRALKTAQEKEESTLGKDFLGQLIQNACIAHSENLPLCQDCGVAIYFVELGEEVRLSRGTLNEALTEGTIRGYSSGYLRKSMVRDPLFYRTNTEDNSPPLVHVELTPGDKLNITLAPKGAGSENMSSLAMLKPMQGKEGVTQFVLDTVRKAGGNPCPPIVVGVGIGGNFELVAYLAKKALLREIGSINSNRVYADFEKELLNQVNDLGIGPQGLGGRTTALAVHIETFPCHIAMLPVAVNINCHAARHATIRL